MPNWWWSRNRGIETKSAEPEKAQHRDDDDDQADNVNDVVHGVFRFEMPCDVRGADRMPREGGLFPAKVAPKKIAVIMRCL
jgi:hypothetical protein